MKDNFDRVFRDAVAGALLHWWSKYTKAVLAKGHYTDNSFNFESFIEWLNAQDEAE